MIAYFDSSALVKNYVEEADSDVVQELLRTSLPVTSRFTAIEIASALARRFRAGQLTMTERDRMMADLNQDIDALYVVKLAPEVVSGTIRLLRTHALRSADALQLACCCLVPERVETPVRFIGFDAKLNEVAQREEPAQASMRWVKCPYASKPSC